MKIEPTLVGVRVPVFDGFVELQDMMPHPNTDTPGDRAIVNAARTSRLGESKGDEADKKLLFYMLRNGHTTPFEQVQFKFLVKAPLVTWWQWVRSRTMSYNAQSGRYTPFEENDFYYPEAWRLQATTNKQSSEGKLGIDDALKMDSLLINHYEASFNLYQKALEMGVAKELARVFLPGFSMYYTWVVSVNAWNLMHFLRRRMAPDAQYEIRAYANVIYRDFFKPLLPWTAEAFEEYIYKPETPDAPSP